MLSQTRCKQSRQWVSQYEITNNMFLKENTHSDSTANDYDDVENAGFINHKRVISELWQYNTLHRKRVMVLFTAIVIVTLNGMKFQFLGLPTRLQSYRLTSYTYDERIELRDRTLSGCGEMTAEQQSLRNRNLSGCEKSPYISPEQAEYFLSLSGKSNLDEPAEPTHITLCKALIDRNAESEGQDHESMEKETKLTEDGSSNPFYGRFRVRKNGFLTLNESREVCTDWERPHSAFMQIISSSIVAYVGSRFGLIYKHNCASTITSDKYLDFDITTVQQIFSQITMKMDERILSLGDVVFDLCQSCIDKENDPEFMRQRQNMKQNNIEDTHHCFLFPNKGEVHTQYFQMEDGEGPTEEILDEEGQIVKTALESVLPLVRNRLYHASLDWAGKAHIPNHEPRSGVIIYLDSQSLPIPFSLYKTHIQDGTTRVSILSSPKCADSKLGDVSCLLYGYELRQYLQDSFSGIEVSFDLVSSTAAAYSRMILSHILICPPGTVTCLFPVLARQDNKSSVIFESQERLSTFHWFELLIKGVSDGKQNRQTDNIRIIPVDKSDMVKVDADQKFVQAQFKSVKEAGNFEGDSLFKMSPQIETGFNRVGGYESSESGKRVDRFSGVNKLFSDESEVTSNSNENPSRIDNIPDVIHLQDKGDYADVGDYANKGIEPSNTKSGFQKVILNEKNEGEGDFQTGTLPGNHEGEALQTSNLGLMEGKKGEVAFDAAESSLRTSSAAESSPRTSSAADALKLTLPGDYEGEALQTSSPASMEDKIRQKEVAFDNVETSSSEVSFGNPDKQN